MSIRAYTRTPGLNWFDLLLNVNAEKTTQDAAKSHTGSFLVV